MRVTMRDVARAAGVSVTTVSYVLSRRQDVAISPATSERVTKAARRLNYRHNALAADLRRGATRLVSIELYSLGVPILARKVAALERRLRAAGYHAFLCHALDADAEETFFKESAARRVRGVVLTAPPRPEVRPYVRQLMADGMVIVASEPVPELGLPYVTVDRGGGAEAATHHLAALGHRRIGVILGFTDYAAQDFLGGYQRARAARQLEEDDRLIVPISRSLPWYEAGARATDELLALPAPPTAILTTDDEVALGSLRAL